MGTSCPRAIAIALGVLLVTPLSSPVLAHTPATQATAQGLVLRLAVGQRSFSVAQSVEVKLQLRNDRTTPVTLIVDQAVFDLVVYDLRGNKVWAWMESRPFPLALPSRVLVRPGTTLSETLTWDQTILRASLQPKGMAAPGTYLIRGVLHATLLETARLRLRTPSMTIVIVRP